MSTSTQYWHVFTVHDVDADVYGAVTLGPAGPPDDYLPNGDTWREQEYETPFGPATYRASFDHEPTLEDKDSIAPDGHRSWEQDA